MGYRNSGVGKQTTKENMTRMIAKFTPLYKQVRYRMTYSMQEDTV